MQSGINDAGTTKKRSILAKMQSVGTEGIASRLLLLLWFCIQAKVFIIKIGGWMMESGPQIYVYGEVYVSAVLWLQWNHRVQLQGRSIGNVFTFGH